jgi:hypothetical protein
MTVAELVRRLKKIDITKIAGDSLQRNSDKVRELNIQQLMQGLNAEGQPLSPKYSDDPYFKSRESALRYARWKKKLFPETPFDTPNLIIIGTYHNSITAKRMGNQVQFRASATFASSIAAKYGNKELGLSPDSKTTAYNEIVRPDLVTGIKNGINGQNR